jgi:hypothetical protein
MGRKVSMWGCSAEVAQRTRPKAADAEEVWTPVPIPLRPWPGDLDDEWQPVPIPIRVAK